MSLVSYLKENTLKTNIGEFQFIEQLGQGGNGTVCLFQKNETKFAIKFLNHQEVESEQKIKRFKDEYFCVMQMPSNNNIVEIFHYDEIDINNNRYSIIIMKSYECSLKEYIKKDNISEIELAKKIFNSLLNSLKHLQEYSIIHRDIKPENIFYDSEKDLFVLGDLGIAHFDNDIFAKEANETKKTDRLANRLFSAPEQQQGDARDITFSADIYSLGQVIYWIFFENPLQGLPTSLIPNPYDNQYIHFLNKFLQVALQSDPKKRFQTISDVITFIEEYKLNNNREKVKDPVTRANNFDEIIRASFTNQINSSQQIIESDSDKERVIYTFMNKLRDSIPNNYWVVWEDGGDCDLKSLDNYQDKCFWILNDSEELKIKKILAYRNSNRTYKNFVILLLESQLPFELHDMRNKLIKRDKSVSSYNDDAACFYSDENKYVEIKEINSGFYYNENDESIKVDWSKFQFRHRNLKQSAILIVLNGHASSRMTDRQPACNLLSYIIKNENLPKEVAKQFLESTNSHHNPKFSLYD